MYKELLDNEEQNASEFISKYALATCNRNQLY